jgi:hypothetical protein
MPNKHITTMVIFTGFALAIGCVTAVAQDTTAPSQPAPQSRMQVTQVKSGWLVAPDVKFSQVNDNDAAIVGGYGGFVHEGVLLVGAGGYWLANGAHDDDMAYGGLVLEWLARTDRRFGFGARVLVGGGSATLGLTYTDVYGPTAPVADADAIRFGRRGGRGDGPRPGPGDLPNARFRVSEAFFIAEPQANVLFTLTDWMRLNAGISYRAVAGTTWLDDRLNGVAGTVAIQFSGGGS